MIPKTCRWLNYRGDQRLGLLGRVLGPNTLGELLLVVDADYNPAANTTRAGLAYMGGKGSGRNDPQREWNILQTRLRIERDRKARDIAVERGMAKRMRQIKAEEDAKKAKEAKKKRGKK